MTAPPTIQTNPLDPVFSGVPVVIPQGNLVNPTWNKWFVDLREKVNVINATLAAWSGITPVTGLTPGTYGDATHYPVVTVNQYGLITNITTQSSSGGGGGPIHVTTTNGTYTVASGDVPAASSYRGMIIITSGAANTAYLDLFANTSIPVGADVLFLQNGVGTTTIAGKPGVSLTGPSITGAGQYSLGRAIQTSQDNWLISGNLAWVSGPPTTFYAYAISLSPVAYWRMNDTSGTNLVDSIAGYTAALTGTYTLNQAGMVTGGASVLWGGGMANTTAASTWALGASDFSMFLFAKWTTTSLVCPVYIRDSGSSNLLNGFFCNRYATGDMDTEGWYWASGGKVSAGTTHNDGNPHSFCATFVNSTKTLSLYIDGTLAGSVVVAGTRPTGSTMQVGIANNTGSQTFAGNLSELILFNYALTGTQISNLDSYRL